MPVPVPARLKAALILARVRGLLLLVLLCAHALAEEPSVPAIVDTIRFHPEGEPARVGFTVLSRSAEPGWRALAGIVAEFARKHHLDALAAAHALAEGTEKDRLAIVAASYRRLSDPEIRAALVYGLAFDYEEHNALLLKHMRENRPGAVAILEVLAPQTLDEQELRR